LYEYISIIVGKFFWYTGRCGPEKYIGIKMTVEIIVDNTCTGCGRCKKVCPKGPIIWDIRIRKDGNPKYFAANPDSCLFCKFCVGVCPVMAITVQNRGTSVSTSKSMVF
jgi:formate hydrogenlyase subunit 6/NADH:ubiquinone oxidoreductase subunit I